MIMMHRFAAACSSTRMTAAAAAVCHHHRAASCCSFLVRKTESKWRPIHVYYRRDQSTAAQKKLEHSKRRNQEILRLGKNNDWKGILNFYEETLFREFRYTNVNYATMMSQLGAKIIMADAQNDASLIRFIDDLWKIFNTRGLEWMGVRETANIVHAIAKMQLRTESADRIVEFVVSQENATILVETGEPQSVANVCWSLAKLGRSDIASILFHELEKHVDKFVAEGSPQEIANAAWSSAKLGIQSPKLFAEIEKHADRIVARGDSHSIAILAWSCATLGVQSPKLFAEIEKDAVKLVDEAEPKEIRALTLARSKLGVDSPRLFAEIEKQPAIKMDEKVVPQQSEKSAKQQNPEIARNQQIVFAEIEKQPAITMGQKAVRQQSGKPAKKQQNPEFARNQQIVKLGKNGDWKGMLNLYDETVRRKKRYNNVNYATTMSQLGRIRNVDLGDVSLVRFIDDVWEILNTSGLEWMGVRETANIVHAIAKMSLRTDSADRIVEFVATSQNAKALAETGEPQELANVCWSLAKLGRSDVALPLFCELEKHADKFVVEGNPQAISNTAWAFAKLGVQSPKLFAEIEKHANKLVGEGKPQDIANTAWACATLGLQSPNLFAEIEKHASMLVGEGKPQEIANTAWACATLGVHSPELFSEIEKLANKLVDEGNAQIIVNTLWAYTITVDFEGNNVLLFLWKEVMKRDTAEFTEEELCQLSQILAFSPFLVGIDLPTPPADLLERIRSACAFSDTRDSSSQKEVSSLLAELGLKVEDEVSPSPQVEFLDSLLAIDMALPEHTLAIEFDGPNHFLRSVETGELTRNVTGPTQAKHRFLEKLGWKVMNIDYRDWDGAEEKQGKLSFLRNELEKVGIPVHV